MELEDLQDELPEFEDDLEFEEVDEWDETEALRELQEVVPLRDLD